MGVQEKIAQLVILSIANPEKLTSCGVEKRIVGYTIASNVMILEKVLRLRLR